MAAEIPGGSTLPIPSLLASSNDEAGSSRSENRDDVLALYVELRVPLLRYALRHRIDLAHAEELVQEF